MPGSTNFLVFNPNYANAESDSAYNSDSQRSGGAASGAVFASLLANKAFYQWSMMVAALATALVNKGYSPNDGNASPSTALTNLATVLANILTNADLATIFTSPAFTGSPTAPTQTLTDNSTKVATDAFVKGQNYVAGSSTPQLIQSGTGTGTSVTFPTAFSAAPTVVAVGIGGSVNINAISSTGFTINTSVTNFVWIAIGNK